MSPSTGEERSGFVVKQRRRLGWAARPGSSTRVFAAKQWKSVLLLVRFGRDALVAAVAVGVVVDVIWVVGPRVGGGAALAKAARRRGGVVMWL